MAILDHFYGRTETSTTLNRFKDGLNPPASSTYKAYGVNDQSSLQNSKLHDQYSTDGTPNIKLASTEYNTGGKTPTNNYDLTPNAISVPDANFSHEYLPSNKYQDKEFPKVLK